MDHEREDRIEGVGVRVQMFSYKIFLAHFPLPDLNPSGVIPEPDHSAGCIMIPHLFSRPFLPLDKLYPYGYA